MAQQRAIGGCLDSVYAVMRVGLLADFARLSTQSQNLSNVNTVGYKRQVAVTAGFDAALDPLQQLEDASLVSSATTDVRPGALQATGRSLDLALDGDGFFAVRTGSGIRYTRRGDFSIDAAGRLVTAAGDPVLGGGSEIVLPNAAVSIDSQGQITAADQQLAQIDVVHFATPQALRYVGAGQFEAGGQAPIADQSLTRVRSGFLEASNVQPAHEMIALLEISRHVELSRNILAARDEMLNSATNTLAQF